MPTSLKWEALPVPGCLVVAAAAAGGRPLVPDSHGHRLQPLIRHTQVEGRQVVINCSIIQYMSVTRGAKRWAEMAAFYKSL